MLNNYKYYLQSSKNQQKLLQNNFDEARSKSITSKLRNQTVINLDGTFKNFLNKQTKYPQFKSKRVRQSIQYPANITLNNNDKIVINPDIAKIQKNFTRKINHKL